MRVKFHFGLALLLTSLSFSCFAYVPFPVAPPQVSLNPSRIPAGLDLRDPKTRLAWKLGLIGNDKGKAQASNTGKDPTDPQVADNPDPSQDKNAAVIAKAREEIAKKNPGQQGGYVAEVIDKGSLAEVSSRNPEFFNNKVRNSGNPVEIGKLIEFDENGCTIAEDFYIKGGGNGNRYGVDKLECMSMPYGKTKNVWQDENGYSQTFRDSANGQWVNDGSITMRTNSNPNSAVMSPWATTERVHPLSGSGLTNGCYGLLPSNSIASTTYGLDSNLEGINAFANARVYLGKINGLASNGNQCLYGYRTAVLGKSGITRNTASLQ